METYANDEERLEALQRWWKENKQSVFGGILLGVAVVAGWNMWEGNRRASAEQASNLYLQLLKADQSKQTDAALKLGERIVTQYGSTSYADYARFLVAKTKAGTGDLAGAKKMLEEELAKSSDDNFKHLARLRLARVMLAAGEVEPALHVVAPFGEAQVGKFAGLYEELKGDLYAAAKRPGEARKAYERAKELGEMSPMLDLKLNDLPAS